jgi:hypothetical protein
MKCTEQARVDSKDFDRAGHDDQTKHIAILPVAKMLAGPCRRSLSPLMRIQDAKYLSATTWQVET